MPKDDAERARPPAHLARTRHPPTHPARAAQPQTHPARAAKAVHERPVGRTVHQHQSPAKRPTRPPAGPQPDSMSEQGHDIALLMRRGLISEKALGRSLPGYQDGGRPRIGEPAMVGELGSDPASAMSAKMLRGEPMTDDDRRELGEAIAIGGGVGAMLPTATGVGPLAGVLRGISKMDRGYSPGIIKDGLIKPTIAGGSVGAIIGALAEHFGGWRPLRDAIDAQAMGDMQPAASGERQDIRRPSNP
jgi:hypothetical protein